MIARAVEGASWLAGRVPLRIAYAVTAAAMVVVFYCWPRGHRASIRNAERVRREAARGIARRSFANYGRYLVDFLRLPAEDPRRLAALAVNDEPFEMLRAGLSAGKGVIVVAFHFGNWDLGAAAAAARGFPISVVAETFSDPRLDRLVVGSRERLGMRVLKMEHAGPSLVRTLREGRVLAVLLDRPAADEGVRAPFFGGEVSVPAGPARLALATGARLMPVAFVRVSPWSDRIRVLAEEPFEAIRTGDRHADVVATTAAVLRAQERFISRYPDQWYMFRDMWVSEPAPA